MGVLKKTPSHTVTDSHHIEARLKCTTQTLRVCLWCSKFRERWFSKPSKRASNQAARYTADAPGLSATEITKTLCKAAVAQRKTGCGVPAGAATRGHCASTRIRENLRETQPRPPGARTLELCGGRPESHGTHTLPNPSPTRQRITHRSSPVARPLSGPHLLQPLPWEPPRPRSLQHRWAGRYTGEPPLRIGKEASLCVCTWGGGGGFAPQAAWRGSSHTCGRSKLDVRVSWSPFAPRFKS